MTASSTTTASANDLSSLAALFEPKSIALVGASDDTTRMGGGMVLKFLQDHGFKGAIYPVNPKRDTVGGLQCYPTLDAVPGPIDLAILVVPAKALPGIFESIPTGHVNIALVMASGFGELSEDGATLEHDMLAAARAKGVRFIGPNSVGTANLWGNLVTSFSQFFDRPDIPPGGAALLTQSGAFGTALLANADQMGMGFGYFVSSGNETDLEVSDIGRYLLDIDDVKMVCGYLESVKKGDAFTEFARHANVVGKPIIVLKVGVSEAGARAARSHTGSLVGSDAVVQAVFDAHNVLRAENGEDMMDLIKVFGRTPEGAGMRIGVLTHSGGAGVMAVDAAEALGAEIPPLSDALHKRLTELLPAYATIANPLDMTGGASLDGTLMADCLRAMLADDAYDAAVLAVNLIWREGDVLMRELADIAATQDKPFVVSWIVPTAETAAALLDAPYPVFADPARAARVLTRRLQFDQRRRALNAVAETTRPATPGEDGALDLGDVVAQGKVLDAYGVRLPREIVATDEESAEAFRQSIGGSVAVKIASPDIAHRTDIGAVVTGVTDADAMAAAYAQVVTNAKHHHPKARIDGVLVQEMVEGGIEVLIGVKRDPVFGPIMAIGLGGVLVELIGDVRLYPAPMSPAQARALIDESRLKPLLDGYRGGKKLDGDALAETLSRVSWLAAARHEIDELDLNPVMVLEEGKGCVALDYKFTTAENRS